MLYLPAQFGALDFEFVLLEAGWMINLIRNRIAVNVEIPVAPRKFVVVCYGKQIT